MSDDLRALEDWAAALLAKLSPRERRQLNQDIARDLRRSQQSRIAAQRNPDGTAFAPRKARQSLRSKKGRIRRKMFTKLKQAKHLKLQSTADSITLGFIGRTARLARVHQYGLNDRPGRNARDVRYARRQILGFAPDELDMIRERIVERLLL